MTLRFFTDRANTQDGGNLIADFVQEVQCPWGPGFMRGMIIYSQRDKRIRVIWPRNTQNHYWATPGKDQLDAAETMILDAFRGRMAA
jgi:hypothetical protein